MQNTYSIIIDEIPVTNIKDIKRIQETENWGQDPAIQEWIVKKLNSLELLKLKQIKFQATNHLAQLVKLTSELGKLKNP